MRRYIILLAVIGAIAAGCGDEGDAADTTSAEAGESTTTTAPPTEPAAGTTAAPAGSAVATDGDIVAVHYVGTLDDGTQFDTSREREPLSFEVGTDQVIAGFDRAVNGLAIGETVTVRIEPGDAYGEVDPELIVTVPLDQAPDDVAVGDQVLIGGETPAEVTSVTDTEVEIDMNHRFAGQALTFEIELVSINNN